MNDHNIVIPINDFKLFTVSANYSVDANDLRKAMIEPQVERVRRRGKVMCWRTASNISMYKAHRKFEREMDEAVVGAVKEQLTNEVLP